MNQISGKLEGTIDKMTNTIRWYQFDSSGECSTFQLPIKDINCYQTIKHLSKVSFGINNMKTHAIYIQHLGFSDEYNFIIKFKEYFLNNLL